MNDVDDILRGLGMSVPSPTPSTPTEASPDSEDSNSSLTDADVSDILEENGYSDQEIQDPVFEGDGHEEEVENESYDENQGEGGDLAIEQADPNYLNALANAEQEEDYEPEENDSLEETREDFNQALNEHIEANVIAAVDTGNGNSETSVSVEESTEETEIPLNSPTLLIDDTTSRFSGTEWYNEIQRQRIIVGGCGGIGSNLLFQLARMVPANITIYDDDNVEIVNMAGQLFSYNDVGKAKVTAMADMISAYTSMRQVNAIKEKFTADTEAGDIMLCGFDNMRARRTFFESWLRHLEGKTEEERAKCLFMDGRLDINTLQILCVRGDDSYNISRYTSSFLFLDSEAEETICSMKQTTYLACMIGSLMVNLFTNFVANLLNPVIPYDMPFFTEYDAQNMLFKTES